MNNKQKLAETYTSVKKVQERYEVRLEKQKEATKNTKTLRQLTEKLIILRELEFPMKQRKTFLSFANEKYEWYVEPIFNRKKRICVVPLCFLVTLYEQDLKAAFPEEEIQIPYTLRGFWKMEKAVSMLEEFVRLQNESQHVLLWEKRRLSKISEKKEKAYSKILDEFVAMRISYNGWKTEICYNDLQFRLNKKNVKLDVVPLCKLLTIYYVRVVSQMEHYAKTYANRQEKEKLKAIKSDFSYFMEKYFTVKTIC